MGTLVTGRQFLAAGPATVAAFRLVRLHMLGGLNEKVPGEQLNFAGIGVGGM